MRFEAEKWTKKRLSESVRKLFFPSDGKGGEIGEKGEKSTDEKKVIGWMFIFCEQWTGGGKRNNSSSLKLTFFAGREKRKQVRKRNS